MKKIEAITLEEAYAQATKEFGCSIVDLDCEIVQHPSSGFMGMFSKSAIIVVAQKATNATATVEKSTEQSSIKIAPKTKPVTTETPEQAKPTPEPTPKPTADKNSDTQQIVLDSFFDESKDTPSVEPTSDADHTVATTTDTPAPQNNIPLQESIEQELKSLIDLSCFNIDTVEVDVVEDTAYIFMDGDDAALLIGKEGYRYNALSYLISNWLQNKHKLFIKLEIAQFLASQQEMIRSYMQPVIEHVEKEGWGRTRPLDGVLVRIALEQLREEFPNKYVAIKRTKNGDRYVLINELNKR